ncbi:hypothetical protein DPV78_008527 [Talaromyces pinophilus]|nr:hypothetical protein DPV78_008527 [Talaromyces pinophilus]
MDWTQRSRRGRTNEWRCGKTTGTVRPVNQSAARDTLSESSTEYYVQSTALSRAMNRNLGGGRRHCQGGTGNSGNRDGRKAVTSSTKSLSEQGPANHSAAAAGNDCDWLAGGPLSAQYSPKNACSVRIVITIP